MKFLYQYQRDSQSGIENGYDDPNFEHLHPVEVNEFLPQIHRLTSIGAGIMLTIFLVGIALATILTYKTTVKVAGTIRPVGEIKLVESAISGEVQRILVQNNQVVSQGDSMAFVDDSQVQTQKKQLEDSIQKSQLQLLEIDSQFNEIRNQILDQTNLNEQTIFAAQSEFMGTQRNFDDQRIKGNAELLQAEIAFQFAKSQLQRLEKQGIIKSTIQEAETALNLAIIQRNRLQAIASSGAIPASLLEEKQQAIKSARAKLESAKNNAQSLWDDKQQAFKTAQINLYKARTTMNPSNSAVIIASQRIKQEQVRGEMTIAALNKELGNLLQQRLEIQKQLTRYRQDLLQTEINLQKTVIRAPITGTLLQLKLRNLGQVVQSGQAIAQIAPLNVPLEIKAYIPIQEINKVQVGRKFQMRVSACPYPDYGTLRGRVKNISPDVLSSNIVTNNLTNNITNNTGTNGYEVTMEPETLYVGKGQNKCYLQPGMEGGADIISREENVMQFILRKARLISRDGE